ncbi:MAG: sensor histidine kinase, partial [Lachnospiraceae bacterium]|nr:sensor histidine kinase [Lachnospiraceae bacterium]
MVKKWGLYFSSDLFLLFALTFGWMLFVEIDRLDFFEWNRERWLSMPDGITSLTYNFSDRGERLVSINAYGVLIFSLIMVSIAFFFQMMNLLLSHYGDYRKIRKTLKPLDDLALKADEISRLTFDEQKFHRIEDAITHMSPEDEKALSLGDEDLMGIEQAMNNLIKRMHDTYNQQARFVNDASHELRTPIAVIEGYANMLDRWGKEDEAVLDESIAAIKNES